MFTLDTDREGAYDEERAQNKPPQNPLFSPQRHIENGRPTNSLDSFADRQRMHLLKHNTQFISYTSN